MTRDNRVKRVPIKTNRRRIPYVYNYEVAEAARELNISTSSLQQYINDRVEEIQQEGGDYRG